MDIIQYNAMHKFVRVSDNPPCFEGSSLVLIQTFFKRRVDWLDFFLDYATSPNVVALIVNFAKQKSLVLVL